MTRHHVQLSTCALDIEADDVPEPPRPLALRHADYEDRYDFTTLVFDCFWSACGEHAVVISPPTIGRSPVFHAQPSGRRCDVRPLGGRLVERFLVSVPAGTTHLVLAVGDSAFNLAIQPNLSALLAGRRVIMTLSRDNHPDWIGDWIHYHRVHHGCDAVLLYDNASSRWPLGALRRHLDALAREIPVVLIDWPFSYGVPDYRLRLSHNVVDSVYSQSGMLEHARRRFLASARSVLNADVDELILARRGPGVFEAAETAPNGLVVFEGRWVENRPVEAQADPVRLPRHADFGYIERSDFTGCNSKWAVVPGRVPEEALWFIHLVYGMAGAASSLDIEMRHFKAINSNWNVDAVRSDRTRSAPTEKPPDRLVLDTELRAALEQAFAGRPERRPDEAAPPRLRAYRNRVRGGRLAASGEGAEALPALRRAAELMPEHPGFRLKIAEVEDGQGNDRAAADARAEAEDIRDGDGWVHYQRGRWLKDDGEMEAARQSFERAIEVDPGLVVAYCRIAEIERWLGRPAGALAVLERCLARAPGDAGAHAALAAELERHARLTAAIGHARTAVRAEGAEPEDWQLLARLMRRAGRLEEALEAADAGLAAEGSLADLMLGYAGKPWYVRATAFSLQPECLGLRLERAQILLALGRLEEAGRAAEAAIELRRTGVFPYQLAAAVARARGDGAAADALAEQSLDVARANLGRPVLASHPAEVRRTAPIHASEQLVSALDAAGRTAEAIVVLEETLRRLPDHAPLHHRLAMLTLKAGDRDRAREVLRSAARAMPRAVQVQLALSRLADDPAEAAAAARAAVEAEPGNPLARKALGAALDRDGDGAEAERQLRAAIELEPNDGEAWDRLGRILEQRGALAEAAEAAGQAARLLPGRADLRGRLAAILLGTGRESEALRVLQEAVADGLGSPGLLLRLADLLQQAGDLEGAIAAADEAVRLAPEEARGHRRLAALLMDAGLAARAEAHLRAALAHEPAWDLHHRLGQSLERQGRLAEAVEAMRQAVAANPGSADLRARLAALLIRDDRGEEAEETLRRAVEEGVANAPVCLTLSNLLHAKQDGDGALALAREAVRLEPGRAAAHRHLAGLLSARGEPEEAETHRREALRLEPATPDSPARDERPRKRLGQEARS
ncbi:MAG TPA: tetratricopeptide repeat protein [Thermohalobaculum sp.]|nr:tetratricopeptide repeat protein [Thermohalobaculum sp.]